MSKQISIFNCQSIFYGTYQVEKFHPRAQSLSQFFVFFDIVAPLLNVLTIVAAAISLSLFFPPLNLPLHVSVLEFYISNLGLVLIVCI